VRAITGSHLPAFAEDEETSRRLAEVRGRLVGGLRMFVDPANLPSAQKDALGNAIVAGLNAAGVVSLLGASCVEGLRLTPTASVQCSRGYFGPQCKLSIDGVVTRCLDSQEITTISATFPGAHPRDEKAAEAQAVEKAAQDMGPALREQLQGVLPLR
jgi:hypothetical protein